MQIRLQPNSCECGEPRRDFNMRLGLFGSAFIAAIMALGLGNVSAAPANADSGKMRIVDGQAFWDEDPGPITEPYWTQGQYKYDPNGYLLRDRWDPEYHPMTVIGEHSGKANCVFRQRVTVTTWEFEHPILRVCRKPPNDKK